MTQETYTLQQLAEHFHLSERTAQRHIREGKLNVIRVSRNCYHLNDKSDTHSDINDNQEQKSDTHSDINDKRLALYTFLVQRFLQLLDPDLDAIESKIAELETRLAALEAKIKEGT